MDGGSLIYVQYIFTFFLSKKTSHLGTAAWVLLLECRTGGGKLGAVSPREYVRSCGPPYRSRLSLVFFCPHQVPDLASKTHVAMHASHAALLTLISKICQNGDFPILSKFGPDTQTQMNSFCSPHAQLLFAASDSVSPLHISLHSSPHNAPPFIQSTFTRITKLN